MRKSAEELKRTIDLSRNIISAITKRRAKLPLSEVITELRSANPFTTVWQRSVYDEQVDVRLGKKSRKKPKEQMDLFPNSGGVFWKDVNSDR